jgi:hypothetical protein
MMGYVIGGDDLVFLLRNSDGINTEDFALEENTRVYSSLSRKRHLRLGC